MNKCKTSDLLQYYRIECLQTPSLNEPMINGDVSSVRRVQHFDTPHTLPRRSPTVRLNGCTAAPIVARAAEGVFVLTRGHNSRMKAFYCALFFFCLTLVLAHPPSPNAKDEDSGENQHRNSTGGVSGPAASPSPVGVPDRSSPATPGRTGAAARGPGRSTRESNVGAAASQVCAAIRGLLRIAGATRTVGLTAVACRRSADLPRSWQALSHDRNT
jgi:hypothetical protein